MAATLIADRVPMPNWLHKTQADEPLPSDQRNVLEQLMETPAAMDLKPVVELYLNRNRKLTDKDFQTFSEILQTVLELEKLEKQREISTKTSETPAEEEPETRTESPPPESEEAPAQTRVEISPPAADSETAAEPPPSLLPSVDLDFLYHGAKPMRPL